MPYKRDVNHILCCNTSWLFVISKKYPLQQQQFFKVADIFLKVPEAKCFWCWRAPCEHQRHKLSRGVWGHAPQDIFKIAHSETLFLAFLEPKNQFPRQGWSLLKFSLKTTVFNEIGQLVQEWGGGMAATEFSVVYHDNFFFQKRRWGTITQRL